jgi:Tfp pilus assembly protein PilF
MPILRTCLLLGLLATSVAVQAQRPLPADRYPDVDPAAQYATAPDPRDRRAMTELERVVSRDANNIPARVQMALVLLQRGQPARAGNEFRGAIAAAAPGDTLSRYARWNYGWSLFESADPAGALEQWQLAAEQHGGRPDWVPLLYALVLWVQGDREGAVEYYAAAVRTDPARWSTAQALEASISEWPVNARFTLESVRQAWSDA